MEKLVRNNIPEIVGREKGGKVEFRIAGVAEYKRLLKQKLEEEVEEYLGSGESEELADILEVVYALARELNLEPERLEEIRREKAGRRGGFSDRKVMDF